MADKNNLVNLGLHTNITEDEIRDALQGQPEPVEEQKSSELDLGQFSDMLYESKDGVFGINNAFDAQQDIDFDQFKDQKWLGGLSTRVSGLDDGFTNTGIEDVYNRSQAAQGNLEKIRNGMFQFVGDTGINVAQGFATLLYGLPSMVVNGEFHKIYDNAVSNALDNAQEEYDKYFDIKRGGNQSGMQQVTNFVFDDVLGGVSFVAGAILTELGLSAATALTLGGAAPAQAAATAGIVARGTRLLKKAVTGGKRVLGTQLLDDVVRAEAQLASSATREAAEAGLRASGAAGARKAGLTAAGRMSRQLLTGAGMEAGMEARHMMNAAGEDHKREYELENGEGSYTPEMEEAFRDEITGYGNTAFMANMALVGASNMLMFPKLFGSGLRNGLRQTKFVDTTKLTAKARQQMAKRMGIKEGQLPRLVDASRATRTGRNLRRLTPGTGVAGTALYEGLVEEGGQGVISRGFEDYISHRYDPRNHKDTENLVSSFIEGIKGSYGTAEGLKEVGIGMLLGAFGIPNIMIANAYSEVDPETGKKVRPAFVGGFTQVKKDNAERDAVMDRIIKLHEQEGDVGNHLAAELNNAVTQRGLVRQADIMANQNDFKGLKDNEANSIFSHASSKILTGRFEDSLIEAKELLDSMSVEDYREMLGSAAQDMTDEELRSRKTQAYEQYSKRMNEVRDAYRKAREIYRGENHDALNAIANLVYNTKDRDAREKAIAESLAERIKGMNGDAILDGTQLELELSMTQAEIDKLTAIEDEIDEVESAEQSEERNAKLKELLEKKEALRKGYRAKGKAGAYNYDLEGFNQQLDDLVNYNRALAAMGKRGVTEVDMTEIEELREDLREVARDRQEMIEAFNDLTKPGGYERFIARMENSVRSVVKRAEDEEEEAMEEERRAEAADLGEDQDTPRGMSPAEAQQQAEEAPDGMDGPPGFQPPSAAMFEDLSQPAPETTEVPEGVSPAEAANTETEVEEQQEVAEDVDPSQKKPVAVVPTEPQGKSPAQVADEEQQSAQPVDNSEPENPAVEKKEYTLKVVVDDPRMTGELNPRYPEASQDITQNGVRVGEEVTLTRGREEVDGVLTDVIHYSVRGNIFRTEPRTSDTNDLFLSLAEPRTARVKVVTRAEYGGTRIEQPRDAKDVLTEENLVDIGAWSTRGQQEEFQFFTRPDMTMASEPLTNSGRNILSKPYAIVKDNASGDLFYVPANMRAVGDELAFGLLAAERAVALVVTGKVNESMGLTLDAANATVKNMEEAFGWDIRNAAGVIDNKRLVDSFHSVLKQYLMLENGTHSEVGSTEHKTYGKRPALIYYPSAVDPGLRIYDDVATFESKNTGKQMRSFLRSHKLSNKSFQAQAVKRIAAMRRNTSFEHRDNVSQVFEGFKVDGETGIVQVDRPVSVKQYYLNHMSFDERVPLVIDGKTYGNPVERLTIELGDVEVPTDRTDTEAKPVELTPEQLLQFEQFADLDLLPENFDEDSPMQRAGKLYSVEGLTQKVTQDALNFITGRLATRMLRHSKTTGRIEGIKADDLKRQVRNDILELPGYAAAKLVVQQPEHPKYEQAKRFIETFDKMLEDKRFDRLMDLGFLELLRESRGIVKLEAGTLADAVRELQQDRDEVVEGQAKTAEDIERDANPMAAFDDNFAFGVDPQAALRFELKLALMTVQHVHSNATTVGALGRKFVNQRTLIGHLNQAMAGAKYNWPAMKKRLEENVGTYPYFQVVLNILDDASVENSAFKENELDRIDMMRNQFVVGMAKNIAEFLSLKVDRGEAAVGPNSGRAANVYQFSSNDTNMTEFVMKELESQFIIKGFYTRQPDGTVLVNDVKLKSFITAMEKIATDNSDPAKAAQELSRLFAVELGMNIPPQALTSRNRMTSGLGVEVMRGIEKDLVNPKSAKSLFGAFRMGMQEALESEDKTLAITDPGQDRESARPAIAGFIAVLSNYQDNLIQNSSKDGSGKLRWQYTAPKHAQKMFQDLMEPVLDDKGQLVTDANGNAVFAVDMEADWTLRNNPLLMSMRRRKNRPYVKFGYVDGIKMLAGFGDVRDFHKMEPGDRLFARLAYFGNNNTYIDGGRQMYSRHMMPTLADKHTMPLIQVPSLTLKMKGLTVEPAGEQRLPAEYRVSDFFNVQEAYDTTIRASIDLELARIRAVQAKKKGEVFATLDAKQQRNDRFVLMPALNGMQDRTDAEIHRAARDIYEAQLDKSYRKAMEDAEGMLYELGDENTISRFNFFDPSKKEFDYVRRHVGMELSDFRDNDMNKQHAFMGFVAKYVIEAMHFNTNVTTALLGDPGAFAKGSAEQTATNMGKRFAALIAPGNVIPEVSYTAMRATYDEDGKPVLKNGKPVLEEVKDVNNKTVRSLVMPERKISESAHLSYLKELGMTEEQLDAYRGYDTADAAEYTTAEEHLSILYAQGKIGRKEFEGILRKVNEGVPLNNQERGWFQPMKPVTVERKDGHLLYIKSASFPLVPGLTKNQSLDELRQFMEANNIQRAAYTSALKVGNPFADMVDVHDAEGKVEIQDGLKDQVIQYKRESVRIQQEVPVSKSTEKVHGSQVAKLILANMANEDVEFELDGETVSGRDLYYEYMEARSQEQRARMDIFASKYDMRVENGNLVQGPEYAKRMAARIVEEAIDRNYDVNELAHLQYDEKTGTFFTPLSQGPSAQRIEQLLISILRKELIEPKISGFSGPIRPETGMQYQTLDGMDASDIVWVKKGKSKLFNGKKLKVAQYEQPNQIIMPWKYAGKLEQFKNEDGTIDMDSLPQEIFQVLAYRIPGQKKASSASFEIVGFLPKSYGDTLIVPEELVGQIGQDYDIDKMFGFLYETSLVDGALQVARGGSEVGTAEERRKSARNRQIDVYHASLRSQDATALLERHSPVTDGYSEELGQQLGLMREATGMPMAYEYNDLKADVARSAKDAIGVFASQNVLHAQIEQMSAGVGAMQYLRDTKFGPVLLHVNIQVDRDNEMKDSHKARYFGVTDIHDDTFLLDYETQPTKITRQEQFSRLLNHAVDNENNQLLAKLNINSQTWGYWSALTNMGYNMETIGIFMATPLVQAATADQSALRQLTGARQSSQYQTMLDQAMNTLREAGFADAQRVSEALSSGRLPRLNKTDLLAMVQGEQMPEVEKAAMTFQLHMALNNLDQVGRALGKFAKAMKFDTKMPKTRSEIDMEREVAAQALRQTAQGADAKGLKETVDNLESQLLSMTVSGQVYSDLNAMIQEVLDLPGESVYRTPLYQEMMGKAVELMNSEDENSTGDMYLSPEFAQDYLNMAKGYLYAQWAEKVGGRSAAELRQEFFTSENNMAARLISAKAAKAEVRNNLFIKHLIAEVNPAKGYPRVSFQGDRQVNVSPIEMHAAFLALATSKDAAVRQLAEDLVVYHLLQGRQLASKGYGKYLPAELLQELGIKEALGFTHEIYAGWRADEAAHDQIMLHMSEHMQYLNKEAMKEHLDFKKKRVKDGMVTREMRYMGWFRTSKGLYKVQEVSNGTRDSFFAFSGPYPAGGSYFATEFTPGQEIQEDHKFTLDINKSNKASSVNGMDSTNDVEPGRPQHTGVTDSSDVPQGMSPAEMAAQSMDMPAAPAADVPQGMSPAEQAAMESAAQGQSREMSVSEFVTQEIGDGVLKNRLLRQLLAFESKLPKERQVKVVVADMDNVGGYNRGTHTLKLQKQLVESGNTSRLVRVLAHEMVHAYTSDVMSMNAAQRKGVPAEVKEAIAKVEKVYTQLTTSPELLNAMGLNLDDLNKFKRGIQVRKQVLSGELPLMAMRADLVASEAYDFAMDKENMKKYYGFTSAKEMVAELLSRPEFAQQLSQIKLSQNETWLDRIVKYIGEILEGLGVQVKTGTYAHEAAALTMDLIQKNAKARGVTIKTLDLSMDQNDVASDDLIDDLLETDIDDFSLDTQTLAKLIDYKRKRIRELKEMRSRYKNDKYLVKRLNERIGLEERELSVLRDDSEGGASLEMIVDMANRELDDAENVVRGANTTGDVRLAQSALQNALSVIEFYADARGIIDKRGPIRDEMNKLVARAATLREDYFEKATAILRAQAKARFRGTAGEKYVKSDSFEKIDDIGGLVSYFMDASRQGRIELSFLDGVMKEAVRQQQVAFNDRAKSYMDKTKAMQEGAYFKKHGFEGFVMKDKDGNPMPLILTIVGGKWEAAHNQARAGKDNKPGEYYKWLHANTGRMDVDRLFDYSGDTVVRKDNLSYQLSLEKTYGKYGAEEMITRQEVLLQQFVDARNAEFDIIDVEVTDVAEREKLKKEWVAQNDPSLHKKYIDGKTRAPKGARNSYLFNMPKKEYHDERFIEMQEDAAAVAYYKEYRKQMKEMMAILPMHKMGNAVDQSQIQSGLFLPAIKRSMINDVMKGDFSGLSKDAVTDSMLRAMTVTEEDLQSQLIDPVTGAKREELPVWFTNKLKSEDYEYNMDRTFLAFAMMATTYESKNKIEDTVRMTRGVMSQAQITQQNSFGRQILSKMGVPLASRTAEDRTRIMRVVDTMVNQFYGHTTIKDVTVNAPRRMWTADDKEKIAKLEEKLRDARTDEERAQIQQQIDAATPKLSAAKTAYGMQQWIQAKGMGWNLPAAATNLLYGTLAVEQYGAGQQEFGPRAARKALATMMHSSLNNLTLNKGYTQTATAKKIQGMMITLDVLKDFTEIRFDPSQYAKNASEAGISAASTMGIKKLRMYEIQRSSEYFVYGAGTMAVLLETKVNGKSLWEQMDENGIIQIDGYRPGEEKHAQLVNKIDQVNKRIHGNYDPNSPIAIKKTFYGPLLMQFKSWLPEAIAQRMEKERYDPYLDRNVKGRWWTLMEHRKSLHKMLLPLMVPVLGRKHQFSDDVSQVDQENMRKSAANFRHMMYLYFMIQAIQALLDDEDDDETLSKYTLNYLMNVMNRAHNDQTAFMNPLAFDKLVGGGKIAALDTMNQLAKLTEATWDTAWGEPTIETGVYAGKSKMLHHGGKLIPHSAAIQRQIRNLDRVLNN